MKTLILSTAIAMSLGAAGPALAQTVTVSPGYGGGGDRDCRMVEKRVVKNGRTVITKERRCDGDRRVSRDRDDRYVDRRNNEPGIYIGR